MHEAAAHIRGQGIEGTVWFSKHPGGTLVTAEIRGLPESRFFGFHIHEGERCTGEGFGDTLNHYNPAGRAHPHHAGDLPSLLSCGGKAYLEVLTDRFSTEEIIGRTVVIHSGSDDFRSQPSGNAGKKIACGEIGRYYG